MALQNDPIERRRTVDTAPGGGAGRIILIIVLVAVVALAIAWAAGLFQVNTQGQLKAPDVDISGGEVPQVDVQAADVDVGTKTETIEVPTVDVTRPGEGPADAGSAEQK
jgi:flagellar basal body-associated protein FliL